MLPLPNVNAIFACLSAPHYYRKTIISDREVFVGPDCETTRVDDRVLSVRTENGSYDLAALVASLPAEQRPDLVVVKADATGRNAPRNLSALRCPRVLLVGDTHHLDRAVRGVVDYALKEPFDLIVMDHTRHHGHFFMQAGLRNVHWIPAFDYVLRQRPIDTPRAGDAVFIGQTGRFHPYRRHVLSAVLAAGVPLRIRGASPEEAADLYAQAPVSLNCSLNGDLNLRVFEVLGSGGLLLTDRLSRQSGLELLFEEDRHLLTYRTADELIAKLRHYLDHPQEADAIRRRGHAELLARHHPDMKRRQLFDLVFDGKVDPKLDLAQDRRSRAVSLSGTAGVQAMALYERLQELHRTALSVTLFADLADDAALVGAVADLPRLTVRQIGEIAEQERWTPRLTPATAAGALADELVLCLPDGTWTEERLARWLAPFLGRHIIALPGRQDWRLASVLGAWGYEQVDPAGFYECRDLGRLLTRTFAAGAAYAVAARRKLQAALPELRSADDCFAAATILAAGGARDAARTQMIRAVQIDRGHVPALTALAHMLEAVGNSADAFIVLEEKSRACGPDPGETERREALRRDVVGHPQVGTYLGVVAPPAAQAFSPQRILIVTNLFPPQEMGGYGRKMWEFAADLHRRGHSVKVLTADAPYLARGGSGGDIHLETLVDRGLQLYGRWEGGRTISEENQEVVVGIIRGNVERVQRAVADWRPDACLFGNIDFLGPHVLHAILALGVPTLHCIGSFNPGYPVAMTPTTPLYRAGPASEWVMDQIREAGYPLDTHTVIYPGARVDYFYQHFQAWLDRPRIAFASLLLPYKGPHLLITALAQLKSQGVPFDCTMAGDTTDANVVEALKAFCARHGMQDSVQFTGFLDRPGLRRLFARSNILVFPSIVKEAFGITQVEAMASGLAVVTSGTGGAREIVRDGVDGLVFQSGDAADLAAKLLSLVQDRASWSALSLRGRARSLEFAIPRSVDRILAVFDEIRGRLAA